MNQEFMRPRLVGERFNKHSVPLELLKDFAALEEMIVEVAKWKFRESHPKQKRIPRGFSKGLALHISGIEDGSAIPIITLMYAIFFPASNLQLFESADVDYFKQARDTIIETIACAEQGKPLPLPAEYLGYFDRFGRGLRNNEYIEFFDKNDQPAKLTLETRRHIIRASKAEEWTEEGVLKGLVSEADQPRKSFELELNDGTKLKAPLADQHLDVILDAFKYYRQNMRVTVQGVIKKDRGDHLKSIESVEHITPIDPLDIEDRLVELAALSDGWLDGKGIALNGDDLIWLTKEFDSKFDPNLPLPYLYPTCDGGIQAEWPIGSWEVSLEINLFEKRAEWQALNLKTNECRDFDFDLSNAKGWCDLNQALQSLSTEESA